MHSINRYSYQIKWLLCFVMSTILLDNTLRAQKVFDTLVVHKKKVTQLLISYHEGALKEIVQLKDGAKDGIQETYFGDGKIESRLSYKNGKPHGAWIYYNHQGNIRETKNYKYDVATNNSALDGSSEVFENKILIQKAYYTNGLKNGKYSSFYSNGEKKLITSYKDDLLVGEKLEYNHQGILLVKSSYTLIEKNGIKTSVLHGPYIQYQTTGSIQNMGQYEFGLKEGEWKTYESGVLTSSVIYKHDKKHGAYSNYSNGILIYKGTYYEDIELNGILKHTVNDGRREIYFKDGKLDRIEHYAMGQKVGVWESYYENGNLKERKEFANDLQVGKYEYWNVKGQISHKAYYKIIQRDSLKKSMKDGKESYWENGQLISETNFIDDQESGARTVYYPSGKLKSTYDMKNESMHGLVKEYYESGILQSEKTLISLRSASNAKTVNIGWYKQFDENGHIIDARYYDSLGENVVSLLYYQNHLSAFEIKDLLQLNFFPDGKLMSMIVTDHFRQTAFAQHFYRNEKIRKLSFQNIENHTLNHVDFSTDGIATSSYSNLHQNPDSLKPGKEMIEKYGHAVGGNYIPNSLYSDSIKQGTYKLIYANGNTCAILNFEENLPDGDFVFFDALHADTLVYQKFSDGKVVGNYVSKFAGIQTIIRGEYGSDLHTEWKEMYKNDGIPIQKVRYDKNKNRISYIEYYDNGQLKSSRNEVNGSSETFDQDGNLLYHHINIADSPKVQVYREYFPKSKQVKILRYYRNDKQDSLAESYYLSGKLQSRSHYKDGKLTGDYIEYDESGITKKTGQYFDNKAEGNWLIRENNKTDSLFYEQGKLSVKPTSLQCSCIDTTLSSSKISFVPSLNSYTSYVNIQNRFPVFLHPVDSLNYKSIFLSNVQTSNNRGSGFASLRLLTFKEFAFTLPADDQLKLVLNACRTKGYISTIDAYVNYEDENIKNTSISLSPKRVSLEYLKGPLKSADTNYKNFAAYFNVKSLAYESQNQFNLEIASPSSPCFVKGILKNFLTLNIINASPLIFEHASTSNYNSNLPLTISSTEAEQFFGLQVDTAALYFHHYFNGRLYKIQASSDYLLAGGKFVSGTIKIPCKKVDTDDYQLQIDKTLVHLSTQSLKVEWMKQGFTRLQFKYDVSKSILFMNFFVE